MKGAIYVLAERGTPVKSIDAAWLLNYLHYDQSVYFSAEDAEEGRQAGDAYDDPGKTRVVGFELKPFLPKKRRGRGSASPTTTGERRDVAWWPSSLQVQVKPSSGEAKQTLNRKD